MAMRWLLNGVMALSLLGFIGVAWLAMHPAPPPAAPPLPPPPAAPPPPPRVAVLTAARLLHAGALLGPDDLGSREVESPGADTQPDTPATRAALLNGMIRQNIPAGAPLHADAVLRPKDRGFLAAVLAPGMRAVSVGVDAVSGAAGLIWPGDRVDLVLTQTIDGNPPATRVLAETLLTDLRVIAVDQLLMQGAVGTEGVDHPVRTVTLEVTPPDAERVAVAARLGRLSLALHAARADAPPADAAVQPTPPAPRGTWAADVSAANGGGASGESLHLFNGPDKAEEIHF